MHELCAGKVSQPAHLTESLCFYAPLGGSIVAITPDGGIAGGTYEGCCGRCCGTCWPCTASQHSLAILDTLLRPCGACYRCSVPPFAHRRFGQTAVTHVKLADAAEPPRLVCIAGRAAAVAKELAAGVWHRFERESVPCLARPAASLLLRLLRLICLLDLLVRLRLLVALLIRLRLLVALLVALLLR